MVIAKIIFLSIAGTATVLGSTSPLMHIGVTKNDGINKGYPKTNELLKLILKDCNAEGKYYTVFLETSGEGEGTEGPKISFRVEKTNGPGKKDAGEIVGKDGEKVGEDLSEGYFGYKSSDAVDFMYSTTNGGMKQNLKADCKEIKIQPSRDAASRQFGDGHTVSAGEVKLSLSTNSCDHNFSSVVCGITINSNNKLQGIKGREPKITYTAFK